MTIASVYTPDRYVGNDSRTNFPFTFPVRDTDNLLVVIADDEDDNREELVLDTDYTISGVGESGSITYPISGDPLPTDWSITLMLNLPEVQEVDYENQGGFFPDTVERSFDDVVQMLQQQQAVLDRCAKASDTSGDDGEDYKAELDALVVSGEAAASAAAGSAAAALVSQGLAQDAVTATDANVLSAAASASTASDAAIAAVAAQGSAEAAAAAAAISESGAALSAAAASADAASTAADVILTAADAASTAADAASTAADVLVTNADAAIVTNYVASLTNDYGSITDAAGTPSDWGSIA